MESVVDNDAKTPLPSPFPSLKSHPWLFLFKNGKAIFYNILEHRSYNTRLLFLKDKYHVNGTSKDGWMVLHDNKNYRIFFFNVYSLETVQLPKLESHHNYAFLFSTPDDPDCYVVLAYYGDLDKSFISFCKVGDKTFVTQTLGKSKVMESLVSFGGNLYGLKYDRNTLVRLEFQGQDIQFQEWLVRVQNITPILRRESYYGCMRSYIAESCGDIILVVKTYLGHSRQYTHVKDINVFKANLCTKEWVEMETIGDRTIFLEYLGGMICIQSDNANVKKNCIYFVNDTEGNVYVFDIRDKSITNLPSSYKNKLYSYPRWIW